MAWRIVLAKSRLNSIPSHVMQYIYLPTKVTNQIDKLQRNFIWATTPKKENTLDQMGCSYSNQTRRGLRITKSLSKNKDSLPNLAWRVYKNTNSLWAKDLIHKHCNMSRPN